MRNDPGSPHDPSISDLASRLRAAEEAIRARDDFIAVAAHELRSPMNALALQVAVLEHMADKTGGPVADEVRRLRRTLERYVRRATVLLDVTRINAGELKLACRPVDVRELVDTVVATHAGEAAFHGCRLDARVDGRITGHWDTHMVEQILDNLVNNAIKYGGGHPVEVSAVRHGDEVRLQVTDHGPGIDEQQRAKIFEKFERVVSTSAYQSGFGLGLWIVGRMVAAHHGRVDVQAGPQGGTVFGVTLPVDAEAAISKDSP
ncbi:sensor histidine kinase [Ramlibacter sp. MMS24-I3-19]|uniref:sensor histidine kinase n=1 Tax=Ramlibacter sp. MMS24-I3-19 TaxID=3416606 RepID=UPI003D03E87E